MSRIVRVGQEWSVHSGVGRQTRRRVRVTAIDGHLAICEGLTDLRGPCTMSLRTLSLGLRGARIEVEAPGFPAQDQGRKCRGTATGGE